MKRDQIECRRVAVCQLRVASHHPGVADSMEAEAADMVTIDQLTGKRILTRKIRKIAMKRSVSEDHCG